MQQINKSILEALGVRTIYYLPYTPDISFHNLGFINGFGLWHRNYYYVLNGKFPYSHARKLYDDGTTKKYGIREAGHGYGADPKEWATCDEYERVTRDLGKEWFEKISNREPAEVLDAKAQAIWNDLFEKILKPSI